MDIRVEIDRELVVSDYFRFGNGHLWVPFRLSLHPGKHTMRVWSAKGNAELSVDIQLKDEDVAVIEYFPRKITFQMYKGPMVSM